MVENDVVQIGMVGRPPGGVCLGLVGGVTSKGVFFMMRLILRRHLSNTKTTFHAGRTSTVLGMSGVGAIL